VKSRFWLVDLNEGIWQEKPCVRLWGVDDQNRRVVIAATQVPPYFYLLPHEDPESTIKRLESDRQRFPNIANISLEKRKLLGREKTVLRVVCSQASKVSTYARLAPKVLGGTSFDDLRLSTHYVTDLNLTTCGWNECEVEPITSDGITADQKYFAKLPPSAVVSDARPRLRLLAFALLVVGQKGSARPQRDPIRALAVATSTGTVSLFTHSHDDDSEILSSFIGAVQDFDPDVIVGYDTNKSQWPYLLQRAKINRKRLTLGRDQSEPHTSVFGHISIAGRANVDLADLAGGIVEIKVKDLKNLATYFNAPNADRLAARDEWEKFALWTDPSQRGQLLEDTKVSAQVSLELSQETIDYPLQLSAVTGMPLDQVLAAAVGFRVDSYFLRVAHHIDELIPSRSELPFLTYRGALVQEPKTGIHSNVAVLDFASMYPNLMRKYNLSPDTLVGPDDDVSAENVNQIPELGHRFRKKPDGFYRIALSSLIGERVRIKRELASTPGETISKVLRQRERAVKVITNACYGYAGWAGARWYVREVAESAAALGRRLITETIAKARELGLEVIYSDTDSIFVSNVKQKVKELIGWVNTDPEMEIRVEREYERVLFTEAMKRYAGLNPDGTLDIVGLEVVRGDWSDIARSVQENVLLAILKQQSTKLAVQNVQETIRRLRNHEIPLKSCVIWKTLTKSIEEYRVRTPHVEVAKKLAKEGWQVTVGDKVAYVIVKGSGALFQRARPYHEVKPEDLDVEYYLENQVKPAAMRILEGFGVTEAQLGA
jgi:DNA polymerase I